MISDRYYACTITSRGTFILDRSYGVLEYAEQLASQWQRQYESNGMAAGGTHAVVLPEGAMKALRSWFDAA